jgi:hypothetical protein
MACVAARSDRESRSSAVAFNVADFTNSFASGLAKRTCGDIAREIGCVGLDLA